MMITMMMIIMMTNRLNRPHKAIKLMMRRKGEERQGHRHDKTNLMPVISVTAHCIQTHKDEQGQIIIFEENHYNSIIQNFLSCVVRLFALSLFNWSSKQNTIDHYPERVANG